jgi:muramoyltetrapeptide carboxypeptidase
MPLIKPPALRHGDTVAIVSPARPSPPQAFDQAVAMLATYGLKAKIMRHANTQYTGKGLYLAGDDADRALDLNQAWADPDIKAIICARGGYGCMRLLPLLDWPTITANPKILLGFSDITALQLALLTQAKHTSFYGPMLTLNLNADGDTKEGYSHDQCFPQLFGHWTYPHALDNLDPYQCLLAGHTAEIEAPLIAGNLSLLSALCGTPYQPDTTGCLLLIEDWHEAYYTLDRKLQQLSLAGMLANVAGVLFCDMSHLTPEAEVAPPIGLPEFLRQCIKPMVPAHVPVGYGFSLGHGAQTATIAQGVMARFTMATGQLTLLEAGVTV